MRLLRFLIPYDNRRREARQDSPKNRARSQFVEAVASLEQKSSTVTEIAEDAIRSMSRGREK